jgi:hypothetical protein
MSVLSSVSMGQSSSDILSIEDILAQKGVKPVQIAYDGNHPYIKMEVATAARVDKMFDYMTTVIIDREECYQRLQESMVSEEELRDKVEEQAKVISSVKDTLKDVSDVSEKSAEEVRKELKQGFFRTLGKIGSRSLAVLSLVGAGYLIGSTGL